MQMTSHLFRSMIRDKIQDRNLSKILYALIYILYMYVRFTSNVYFFIVKLKIEFCLKFRRAIYRSFKVDFNKYCDLNTTHAHRDLI